MKQNGFTLIELMMALAIIGVLAAAAMPIYGIYSMRAKAAELVQLGDDCKTKVTEYYSSHGSFPTSNDDAGCYSSSDSSAVMGAYTKSIEVLSDGTGIVRINANEATFGSSGYIEMVPSTGGGTLEWTCAQGSILPRYLPGVCRHES